MDDMGRAAKPARPRARTTGRYWRAGPRLLNISHLQYAGDRLELIVTRQEIFKDFAEILEDVMDVEDVALTDETTADDIEEWDSLSHVRLIVAIERKYGIKFTNTEIAGMQRVKDVIDLIEAKAAA
jgi:acyl carrier protein